MRWNLRRLAVAAATAAALLGGGATFGFDTGHHRDLTVEVLRENGFGDQATKAVVVANWLVDYYSNAPAGQISGIVPELDKLHFDNLFTTSQVRNYWENLMVNTRFAVQQAAREKDVLKCITLLGASLHAVQDFSTHSNWPETHPPVDSRYRTDTWFDRPRADNSDVHTGHYPDSFTPPNAKEPHGSYTNGLNHDSYMRPRWDQAYVFSYVTSRRWVAAVKRWVDMIDPTFWPRVQNFQPSPRDAAMLEFDLNASYRISEWIMTPSANGHWKGFGSGDPTAFARIIAQWTPAQDSIFVNQFKVAKVHRFLIPNLSSDDTPIPPIAVPVPTVPAVPNDRRAVVVRMLAVSRPRRLLDPLGANFFAQVIVDGLPFVEATQVHNDSLSVPWTTIKFVPVTQSAVTVHYDLLNEGGVLSSTFTYSINPNLKKKSLDFSFKPTTHVLSGDATGRHDTPATAVVSTGGGTDKATVRYFVTEVGLR